jgi:hypothetical protein
MAAQCECCSLVVSMSTGLSCRSSTMHLGSDSCVPRENSGGSSWGLQLVKWSN